MRPSAGWRRLVTVGYVVTVAVVPGTAMAMASISAAASAVCGFGSFCLFSGPDFTGQKLQYTSDQLFCQGSLPGLDLAGALPGGARSVYNNTGGRTSGLSVKIYNKQGQVAIPTLEPGGQVRKLDQRTAVELHTLCTYVAGRAAK